MLNSKRPARGLVISCGGTEGPKNTIPSAEDLTKRAMRSLLIFLVAVVGAAVARPRFLGLEAGTILHAPVAYSTISATAPVAAVPISSQFHAQDELGQYSYGYAGGPSAKSEVKTFDGVTRGGYSYVDAEGKVQNVKYVADAVNGFRVSATNLPVAPEALPVEPLEAPQPVEDTPEVAAAKEAHFAAYEEAKAKAEAAPEEPTTEEESSDEPEEESVAPADLLPAGVLSRNAPPSITYSAYAPALAYRTVSPAVVSAPVSYHTAVAQAPISYTATVSHAPISYHAAVGPITYASPVAGQFHAQDEIAHYSYGYAGGPSAKSEVKTFDGITHGGYSYVDAEGQVQNVNYVADPIHGFHVSATNLPVAPAAPEVSVLETVPDSPEVAAAKAEHFAAHEEAKARLQSA
ncbi:hypothetical protein J437_LFUL016522 [Ladona fulva]|uniref:Cuticle protein 6 n=1 Tax=Ladona fulva TaxID=123851 RepID=A0A8K0KIP0_LADFU|nr:hypothetical protein J437_LFUL016522 [Ladona fulva]